MIAPSSPGGTSGFHPEGDRVPTRGRFGGRRPGPTVERRSSEGGDEDERIAKVRCRLEKPLPRAARRFRVAPPQGGRRLLARVARSRGGRRRERVEAAQLRLRASRTAR